MKCFYLFIVLLLFVVGCRTVEPPTVEEEAILAKNFDEAFQYAVTSIHSDSTRHGPARNWITVYSPFQNDFQKKLDVSEEQYKAALKLLQSEHIILGTLGYTVLSHSKRKEAYPVILDGIKKYQMKGRYFMPEGCGQLGDDQELCMQKLLAYGALGGAIIEIEPYLDDVQRVNLNEYLRSNLDDDVPDGHSNNHGFMHMLLGMTNRVDNFKYLLERAEKYKLSEDKQSRERCFNALRLFKDSACIDTVFESIPRHYDNTNSFLDELGYILNVLTNANPSCKKVVAERLLKMYRGETEHEKRVGIQRLLAKYINESPEVKALLQSNLVNTQNRAQRIALANEMLEFAPDIACPVLEKERHFYTLFRHDHKKYLGAYLDYFIETQMRWYDTFDIMLKLPKECYIPHIKKFEKLLYAMDMHGGSRPDFTTRCVAWICIYRATGEGRKVRVTNIQDADRIKRYSYAIRRELENTNLDWKDYVEQPPYKTEKEEVSK